MSKLPNAVLDNAELFLISFKILSCVCVLILAYSIKQDFNYYHKAQGSTLATNVQIHRSFRNSVETRNYEYTVGETTYVAEDSTFGVTFVILELVGLLDSANDPAVIYIPGQPKQSILYNYLLNDIIAKFIFGLAALALAIYTWLPLPQKKPS